MFDDDLGLSSFFSWRFLGALFKLQVVHHLLIIRLADENDFSNKSRTAKILKHSILERARNISPTSSRIKISDGFQIAFTGIHL